MVYTEIELAAMERDPDSREESLETFNHIQYSNENGVLVLKFPEKDFVMEQSQDVVDLVFDKMEAVSRQIVMDLTGVSYINSSGISVIIRLNLERTLRLVNPSPMVNDILELTGVLPFIPTCKTVEEAVASF